MIKDSTPLTKFCLVLSVIVGGTLGLQLWRQPVSQALGQIRFVLLILFILSLVLSVIGITLCKKFNLNDEYVINYEDKEYFEYLESNFKYYLSFSPIVGGLLLGITFVLPFHIDEMFTVLGVMYFAAMFFMVCPIFDEIYTIINAIRYNYHG